MRLNEFYTLLVSVLSFADGSVKSFVFLSFADGGVKTFVSVLGFAAEGGQTFATARRNSVTLTSCSPCRLVPNGPFYKPLYKHCTRIVPSTNPLY